jgi:large subunit ribosomal protein L29
MAKKDSIKKESLRTYSVKELDVRLREAEEARFRLLFRHATSPLKNPMEIRQSRRTIARLKTALRQKGGTN